MTRPFGPCKKIYIMAEVDDNANAELKLTGYERIKDTSHRFCTKKNSYHLQESLKNELDKPKNGIVSMIKNYIIFFLTFGGYKIFSGCFL